MTKLVEGSVRRHLLDLALPMTVGLLAMMSKNLVDTYFVAQLGTAELSAISFTFPIILLLMSVIIGLGAGSTSVVSRAAGEGETSQVQRRCTDALLLSVVLVSAAGLLGLVTCRPVFRLLGAEGEVLELVLAYMQPWYLGLVALICPMVGNGLLRANGEARLPGVIMVCSALLNAILDPLLIFGLLGLPRLGITGASLATVISNVLTSGVVLWLLAARGLLTLSRPSWPEVKDSWRRIIVIALPAAGANTVNPLGLTIVTGLLARLGPEIVAGFGVATRIETLSAIMLFALSASIGPLVGQNYGAGRPERVGEGIKVGFQLCVVWGVASALLVGLTAEYVVPLFDESTTVQQVAVLYLWVVPITFGGYGMNIVQSAAFNALGRPFFGTLMTLLRMMVYVPAAAILMHFLGAVGVFVGAGFGNLAGGAFAWMGYRWLTAQIRTKRQDPSGSAAAA
ncbi:MAG: MATE family efflux transporter [Myxococcota bacterium]